MLQGPLLKSLFLKGHNHVPSEYRDELQLEIKDINIQRDRLLAMALVILSVVAIGFQIINLRKSSNNSVTYMRFIYIYMILMVIALVYLLITCRKSGVGSGNLKLLKIVHITLNDIVLIFCTIISVEGMLIDQLPFTYVIAAFSIATLEVLEINERRMIFLLPYLVYFFGILSLQRDIFMVIKSILYFTVATGLALMISGMNYSFYINNFINNKIIIKKNQELLELQKTTEEALERRTEELNKTVEYEKLRTAFFANISHELRTPLNLIYSAEQMLEFITFGSNTARKQNESGKYMNIMKQNCFRLIRLIANLIDTTKIDAGYFNVNLKNCDIVKVVEDITLSAAQYIGNRNIDLIFDTDIEELVVACDPDKIERIILNLLSNAVKFTPEGGKIEVSVFDRKEKLVISVKDTGIGIPPEMKDSIFERFVQVDKSTSRSREGSGIGLSIVKSLIEMHNGTIYLISEVGKGSEFLITLPKAIIIEETAAGNNNLIEGDHRIEKVNVEFSDIYN